MKPIIQQVGVEIGKMLKSCATNLESYLLNRIKMKPPTLSAAKAAANETVKPKPSPITQDPMLESNFKSNLIEEEKLLRLEEKLAVPGHSSKKEDMKKPEDAQHPQHERVYQSNKNEDNEENDEKYKSPLLYINVEVWKTKDLDKTVEALRSAEDFSKVFSHIYEVFKPKTKDSNGENKKNN